jgi:hypothetical protein
MNDNIKILTLVAAGALLGWWWAKRKPCGCAGQAAATARTSDTPENGSSYDWLSGGWRA